ncbi:hypothetical protein Agabi119p4_748 [Agaricus bisporus var. burnettii]|uniref:Uncharacterized protein n=1 Tax=Agaricus bisporus var. burnettii TaxID=192524 RepID=A0A8H7KL22_AGABI|nr:hypothetical protein Agabi119p4_748 [Agaricus bisporus var. burnettii]
MTDTLCSLGTTIFSIRLPFLCGWALLSALVVLISICSLLVSTGIGCKHASETFLELYSSSCICQNILGPHHPISPNCAFNAGNAFLERSVIKGLPIYINSTLRICNWVPSNLNLDGGECEIIWAITKDDATRQQNDMPQPPAYYVNSASSLPSPLTEKSTPATPSFLSTSSATLLDSATQIIQATQAIEGGATSVAPPIVSVLSSPTKGADTLTSIAQIITATPVVSPTAVDSAGRNGDDDDDEEEEEEDDDDDDDNVEGNEVDGDSDGDERIENGDDDDLLKDVVVQRLQRRADTPTSAPNIDPVCLKAWHYPVSILENTIREDIVFIAFQFWVLGMSIVALLNESIPHILASLVTHVVATVWGSLQLVHTTHFRIQFGALITEGACRGVSQSPITSHYWDSRKSVEAVSLAFNVLALLVSCFLSWRLFKLFGWQTFKRVGASRTINRMYKLVLMLSITIQLSFFFVAVTVSLWLDRLFNNVIGDLVDLRKAYLASCIITLVLLIPWLMMGWFGSRRELRIPMLGFLGLCVVYLGGWGVMFISTTFRWTFITWDLFSIMSVAGLLHHLSTEDEFPGSGDFGIVTPDHGYVDEKIEFPPTEAPMPTFNAPYGNGVSSQRHSFVSNGSRSYTQGSPPMVVAFPPPARTRSISDRSSDSFSSEESGSSGERYSQPHNSHAHTKRWVIE